MAVLLVAIAIFSIQNIENVSLKFLTFESIDVPVGVLLAFASAVGIMLGALIPILFARQRTRQN
ncbi:MAG: DUF1049 domain-containing protein [Cyanobacteria bacterium J06600_6]